MVGFVLCVRFVVCVRVSIVTVLVFTAQCCDLCLFCFVGIAPSTFNCSWQGFYLSLLYTLKFITSLPVYGDPGSYVYVSLCR